MPASPICEVKDGVGSWVATTNGVDVTPGNTISVRLEDSTDVTEWYLRIFGTDELTPAAPTLTDVNPLTHKVTTPATVVTFTAPVTPGHALLFESVVVTTTQTIPTTFGVYELADNGLRVGAIEETREGSIAFGWAKMINEAVRAIGSGFTAGGDLDGTSTNQIVIGLQGRTLVDTVPADGDALVWNNGSSQWEPGAGGSSITLGGDLGPWSPPDDAHQRVVGVDTIQANLAATAVSDYVVTYQESDPWSSPRSIIVDGDEAWVAEHDQTSSNYPIIRRMSLLDNSIVAEVDLSPYVANGVRDIAQDDDYVYCAGWSGGLTAIIEKASNTVVGWGSLANAGASGRQVTSVCADNAGNFYIVGWEYDRSRAYCIARFSTAACLGASPDAVFPAQVSVSSNYQYLRKIRYWNGSLWTAGGNSGYATLIKFDPATLAIIAPSIENDVGRDVTFAEGFVWVSVGTPGVYKYDTDCVLLDSVSTTGVVGYPDGIAYLSGYIGLAGVFDTDFVLVNTTTMVVDTTIDLGRGGWGLVATYESKFILAGYDDGASPLPGIYEVDGSTVTQLLPAGQLVLAEPPAGGGEVTAINSSMAVYPANEETVTICTGFTRSVYLPAPLADGEKHTIVDGSGWAYAVSYRVRIFDQSFSLINTIMNKNGSLTFIWSEAASKWVVR